MKIKFRIWINLPLTGGAGKNGRYISADRAFRENFIEFEADGNEIRPMPDDGNVCIEMFTTQFDKHRKEIYKGDILKVDLFGEESIHTVIWGGHYDYPAFDLKPLLSNVDDVNSLSYAICAGKITIIGNIHQNPELL